MKTLVLRILVTIFVMVEVSFAATTLWVSIGTNTIFNPLNPTYERTYDEDDSIFILQSGYYLAPYQFGYGEALRFIVTSNFDNLDNWNLEIGVSPTFLFNQLQVGLYENASRSGGVSTNQNHIDFGGHGSGENSTKGWFKILEIEKDTNGKVTKLAVDFSQQGSYNNPNYQNGIVNGSFRYNSAIAIPEPQTIAPLLISAVLFLSRRKRY